MISVLCPSRGRPEALARSANSLLATASEPLGFELLVAVDLDDRSDYGRFNRFVADERWGYAGLNRYYNLLAGQAIGDWLLVWNDDALMETPGWDAIIGAQSGFKLLATDSSHGRALCAFPVIPRSWYEQLGYLSPQTHTDSWLEAVARRLGVYTEIPVFVRHDRADITGNNNDQVYRDREYRTEEFNSEEYEQFRERDVARLARFMAE